MAALAGLYAVAAGIFLRTMRRSPASGGIVSNLNVRGVDFHDNAMAHVLDLTPAAHAELRSRCPPGFRP